MKKFGKFLFGTLSLAAAVGGVYCLYKNRVNKDADADFDDFDDVDEDDLDVSAEPEDREYVSITITSSEPDAEDAGSDKQEEPETETTESVVSDSTEEISEHADAENVNDNADKVKTAFVQDTEDLTEA